MRAVREVRDGKHSLPGATENPARLKARAANKGVSPGAGGFGPLCRRRAAAEGNDMLDVAVIGCGIVGANVAYLLSQHKLRAAVFEKENDVSMGTTRANSAIVHAGYDPEPGTAMARLNVRGSALTKEQCAAFDVKYRQIGSLVLAFSDEEMATVRRLYENGVANGVPGRKRWPWSRIFPMRCAARCMRPVRPLWSRGIWRWRWPRPP